MIAIMDLGEFLYHVRYDLFTMLDTNNENRDLAYFNSSTPSFSPLEFMDFIEWSFAHYFYLKGRNVRNHTEDIVLYKKLFDHPIQDNHVLVSFGSVIDLYMNSQKAFKEDHTLVYSVMVVGSNLLIGAETIE